MEEADDEVTDENPLIPDHLVLIIDEIMGLLAETRFSHKRTRESAEKAVSLMELHQITHNMYLQCRGLVVYPDLLQRFLDCIKNNLHPQDLRSMICRCIERNPNRRDENGANGANGSNDDWRQLSLNLLLIEDSGIPDSQNPFDRIKPTLQLLSKKYNIDLNLYNQAKETGFCDLYFDRHALSISRHTLSSEPYLEPDCAKWEDEDGKYYGYREAYHLFLHGTDFTSIMERWKDCGTDCTFEAAQDFFDLGKDATLGTVCCRLQELTRKR